MIEMMEEEEEAEKNPNEAYKDSLDQVKLSGRKE